MKYNINDIFKNKNLTSEELAYWNGQLNEIDKDFSNGEFKFSKLRGNKSYYDILLKYLELNGYGFLCSKIRTNMNQVKLAKLLIDSNLVEKPSITRDTNLKNEIVYDKEFGFKDKYYLKFNIGTFPFEITNIYYKENENLKFTLDKSNQKIEILIDIKENTEVNLQETIIIYTTLGLEKVPLSIKCNTNLNSEISIKDFQEFKNLCETKSSEAKKLFQNNEFREWLDKKGYMTQVLNYDEAFMMSRFDNGDLKNLFSNFCLLNEIYNINTDLDEKVEKDCFKIFEEIDPKLENKEKVKSFVGKDNTSNSTSKEEEAKEKNEEKSNKKDGLISKIKGFLKKR